MKLAPTTRSRLKVALRLLVGIAVVAAAEERARTFSFEYRHKAAVPREALGAAANELLASARRASGFRGCAEIVVGDAVVLARCEAGDGPPLTPRTRFSIGSLSKQLVGFAIQERAIDGRLRLDEPISRWLPELVASPSAPVTIRQALHMRSGLPFVMRPTTNAATQLSNAQRSDADFLREVREYPLGFVPGARFQYSNIGYGLLAITLGRVDGRPWREVVGDLLARASMRDAGVLSGVEPRPAVVAGHAPLRCGVLFGSACMLTLPRWNYSMLPGGGVYASVDDMVAWAGYLSRVSADEPDLFSAFTSSEDGYASGLGIEERTLANGERVRILAHDGEDPGYFSFFARVPARDLTVVVLSNTDFTIDRARFTLFDDILALALGDPFDTMQE